MIQKPSCGMEHYPAIVNRGLDRFPKRKENYMSPLSASLHVSRLLGHERPGGIRGCLASTPKDGADGK